MEEKPYYRRLRELREDHDYTQRYVANVLGLSQRGYSHYETGHYELTASALIKLSKLYNVSTDYILGLTPNPSASNSKSSSNSKTPSLV